MRRRGYRVIGPITRNALAFGGQLAARTAADYTGIRAIGSLGRAVLRNADLPLLAADTAYNIYSTTRGLNSGLRGQGHRRPTVSIPDSGMSGRRPPGSYFTPSTRSGRGSLRGTQRGGVFRIEDNPHGPVSGSNFKLYRKPSRLPRLVRSLTQPYTWTDHATLPTVTTDPGLQNYFSIPHLFYQQVIDFRNRLIQLRTGSELNGSTVSFGGQVRRERLGTYSNKMQFLNTTNHPMSITIMELACKRDLTPTMFWQSPAYQIGSGIWQWDGTPSGAFTQGYAAEHSVGQYTAGNAVIARPPTVSNQGYQYTARDYGANPLSVPLFRDYFKVKRSVTQMLQPNEIHIHNVNISPNMMLDNCKLRNYGTASGAAISPTALAGLTVYTFVIIRGIIAKSNDANQTTTSGGGVSLLQSVRLTGSVTTQVQKTRAAGQPFPFASSTSRINVLLGQGVRDTMLVDHAPMGPEAEPIDEPVVDELQLEEVEIPDPEDVHQAEGNPPLHGYVPPEPPP